MEKRTEIILEQIDIPEIKRKESLSRIAEAVKEKQYGYQPSWWEIFRGQIKYISGFCLDGQVLCLLVLLWLFGYLQDEGAELQIYLGTASVAASYMGIFLMLELSRSRSFGVLEIEQTCYLNLKQIWCVKMILFGCLDMVLLTVMILGVAGNTAWSMFRVMLYLLVPFVVSNALQLWVFTRFPRGKKEYLQMGTAVLVSAASLLPPNFPQWYTVAYLGVWILVFAAALGFLIKEIVWICQRLDEGEVLYWNQI